MSRIVFITGGTRGIGQSIAVAFAAQGDTVIVGGRRPPAHDRYAFAAGDVRDPANVDQIITDIVSEHGGIDVLVNNAGGSPSVDSATASPRFTEAIFRLNLTAPFVLAQRVNREMQAKGGVIVNICSVSGLRASPGTAAYGAAKAGLINLTKTLGVEWAPKVRVVAITPGLIATENSLGHYPNPDAVAATVPMGRFGTPQDVAHAVLFACSPGASYLTGSNIVLDGGGEWPAFLRVQQENS
ncbi:MAG: SDR family oxidoreductase [Rhodobacterales bacterium]|nr:SDR family oxidoreductase [Rhodobacterales bacterium]